MIFSSKSEYGVRVMVELAKRAAIAEADQSVRPVVSLAEIAERHAMPLAYLEHLVARLRRAGLIDSRRGARGGYMLARAATDITAAEIIEALEGSIAPIECISLGPDGSLICSREEAADQSCPTKLLWTRVRGAIVSTLLRTTLDELLDGPMRSLPIRSERKLQAALTAQGDAVLAAIGAASEVLESVGEELRATAAEGLTEQEREAAQPLMTGA